MGSETDDIIDECFESPLQNYQERLEESVRGSEFLIVLIYYFTTCKK